MGWESPDVVRSNDGSLALVSCLSGGYRFASVLQCIGLVISSCCKMQEYVWYFGAQNRLFKHLVICIQS